MSSYEYSPLADVHHSLKTGEPVTCPGYARTQDRRCRRPIGLERGRKVIAAMCNLAEAPPPEQLEQIAMLCLCSQDHTNQASKLALVWTKEFGQSAQVHKGYRPQVVDKLESWVAHPLPSSPFSRHPVSCKGPPMSSSFAFSPPTPVIKAEVSRLSTATPPESTYLREQNTELKRHLVQARAENARLQNDTRLVEKDAANLAASKQELEIQLVELQQIIDASRRRESGTKKKVADVLENTTRLRLSAETYKRSTDDVTLQLQQALSDVSRLELVSQDSNGVLTTLRADKALLQQQLDEESAEAIRLATVLRDERKRFSGLERQASASRRKEVNALNKNVDLETENEQLTASVAELQRQIETHKTIGPKNSSIFEVAEDEEGGVIEQFTSKQPQRGIGRKSARLAEVKAARAGKENEWDGHQGVWSGFGMMPYC